ncbi:hypothetical protein PF010_g24520 [Phytophthora fragariae]|uniref:Uncharacterized protein n=1 Tax=Phytophthora fragariae TaxID=53985 RepID=A0A6G0K3A5_9STRA|nr:hypothetical protein PF010_g24520 [Phytophthora fragariae]KAE9184335.1 hypothetical protein PF004_g23691 [Phytophthora fragariae]
MNLSLFDACLRQYQAELANDELNQLRGVQYVYALWGALFAVPVSVLTESEDRYGEYGRALKKWWDSTAKYARASKEAGVSSGKRTAEVFRVGFLVALLCVSLLIHLPLAAYNLLELLLLGKVGVALALLSFNCANYYLEWTRWGLPASVIVVAVGLTSCIWRMGEADGPLMELTPSALLLQAWEGMRTRAEQRQTTELESLRRLQADVLDDLLPFHDALEELPATAVPNDRERNPVAISAEQRAAEERNAALRQELVQHSVRRGRRTVSRGECPAPQFSGPIPAGPRPDSSYLHATRDRRPASRTDLTTSYGQGYRA